MKLAELRRELQARGLAPRARFGQNFLCDPKLLNAIVQDAGVQAGDRVLEIGPGPGTLTETLLEAGAEVLAVEIDLGLFAWLQERLAIPITQGRLHLVRGDVLAPHENFHPQVDAWWKEGEAPPRVVANLPYAISGPFLGRLPGRPLKAACLLLQKEVAEKAAATAGTNACGPLSIRLALNFEVRVGRKLSPQVFWPRPEVQSALLHLHPLAQGLSRELDSRLSRVLQIAFSQRRKRVFAVLQKQAPEWVEPLQRLGVESNARAEQIDASVWLDALRNL